MIVFSPSARQLQSKVASSALGLILVLGLSMVIYGQKLSDKCFTTEKNQRRIQYRIGNSTRTVKEPIALIIHISIKPQHFNREDMVALARQLNRDFCNEQFIVVLIFDSYRSAQSYVLHPHSETYQRDLKSLRGFYDLNRTTGEESVRFASSPGKPRNEIKIDLGSKPSP
jgi:hypothetical protein